MDAKEVLSRSAIASNMIARAIADKDAAIEALLQQIEVLQKENEELKAE